MINPFGDLGLPDKDNPQGELVEGSFACQELGCFRVSYEARYLEQSKILTWICEDDHISKIEGFDL